MSKVLELKPAENDVEENFENFSKLNEIERVDGAELSYNQFFWDYMKLNRPVIITSIANKWNCSKEWVSSGEVDLHFLTTKIGHNSIVPVANCSKTYFNSHEKSELTFSGYVNYWENRTDSQDILYLKDWHLKASNPNYDFYEVPKYFASDWLNEYLIDTDKDDYRFVYIGPKNSWTPFHSDVFSSFSWSTNISGLKKWIILPPGEELKVKDNLGNDPFTINEDILIACNAHYFTVIQKEYESIFVPSGWYHQVWNVTDTISVNHNWFNGCNIRLIWQSLRQNFYKVVEEISDCRDMENFDEHCQIMLKAVFGLNFNGFFDILENIAKKRMSGARIVCFEAFELNSFHVKFDLRAICDVLETVIKDASRSDLGGIGDRCDKLFNAIRDFEKLKT